MDPRFWTVDEHICIGCGGAVRKAEIGWSGRAVGWCDLCWHRYVVRGHVYRPFHQDQRQKEAR